MRRRDFTTLMSIGAVFTTVKGFGMGSPKRLGQLVPADRKLRIAMVGVDGRGKNNRQGMANEEIVALCDVDSTAIAKALKEFPKARQFKDYRKMLVAMDDQIDAVVVSTPDHMHFPVAMMAIQLGKHVFVEKPMSYNPWEARQMRMAVKKHNVISQMGNQGHAGEGGRLVKEWYEAGLIGDVKDAYVWTNKPVPGTPQKPSPWWPDMLVRPTDNTPVPETLDWNLWLGVAPTRPYSMYYHAKRWRRFWEFGTGGLGDMACHVMDAAFYALSLGAPTSVVAESIDGSDECAPAKEKVTWEFEARGDKPPITLSWFGGAWEVPHAKHLEDTRKMGQKGGALIGEKGTIMWFDDYCKSPRVVPESLMQDLARGKKLPPKTIPRIPQGNHWQEWIDGCKGGALPGSNFDHSGPLSEIVTLGNVAIRTGEKIEWNAKKCKVTNIPEANQYVRRPYRIF